MPLSYFVFSRVPISICFKIISRWMNVIDSMIFPFFFEFSSAVLIYKNNLNVTDIKKVRF